jgi:hypothetical protein
MRSVAQDHHERACEHQRGKLEQLKSRNAAVALREQADTIQQLKTAREKDAADNARLAAQVQALQTQLTGFVRACIPRNPSCGA